MDEVGFFCFGSSIHAISMAFDTRWLVFDIPSARIGNAISVHLLGRVAIETCHSVSIVHIGSAAIIAGKFGVDSAPMTERAGLFLIFSDKFVTVNKTSIYARNDGALNMAITA